MNIVTIMNYDWKDTNVSAMCRLWIKQAKIWLSDEDSCFIFSEKPLPSFLMKQVDQRFKNCVRKGVFPKNPEVRKDLVEMFWYKMYVTTQIDFPFLFLDADAIIVDSLLDLNAVFESGMPFVAVNHETSIKGHTEDKPPFLNSGVFIVNDPERVIYDWDLLYNHALKSGFRYLFKDTVQTIPGNDQAVLYSYCKSLGYDYTHENMDIRYNTCAALVETKKVDGIWRAYNRGKRIHIFHYWYEFKPWKKLTCSIFEEEKKNYANSQD